MTRAAPTLLCSLLVTGVLRIMVALKAVPPLSEEGRTAAGHLAKTRESLSTGLRSGGLIDQGDGDLSARLRYRRRVSSERRRAMRAAEFTGRILTTGAVEIPAAVWQELRLRPGLQVRVVLLREEDAPEELERLAKSGEEAWRKVDEIREQLSGMAFNATEAVLRARHEEDEPQ
jgi:hypothetical protein